MPELPQKKVGIVACSGEELAEGTVTRLAALKSWKSCARAIPSPSACRSSWQAVKATAPLPNFTRPSPSMAAKNAAPIAARKSIPINRPEVSWSQTWLPKHSLEKPEGKRKLNEAGLQVVDVVASRLPSRWMCCWEGLEPARRKIYAARASGEATGRSRGNLLMRFRDSNSDNSVNGQEMTMVALPLIFQNFHEAKKAPSEAFWLR